MTCTHVCELGLLSAVWPLASNAADVSGYGQHLTAESPDLDNMLSFASTDSDAPFGDGYGVFGEDRYAMVEDFDPRLDPHNQSFTIEFWFKITGRHDENVFLSWAFDSSLTPHNDWNSVNGLFLSDGNAGQCTVGSFGAWKFADNDEPSARQCQNQVQLLPCAI